MPDRDPTTCIVVFLVELVGEHCDPLFKLRAGGLKGGEARTQLALLGLVLPQQVLQHLLRGLLRREGFLQRTARMYRVRTIN